MVRENFFKPSLGLTWAHRFTNNETLEQRKAWLSGVMKSVGENGIEIAIHERLDGQGYDFGFLHQKDYKGFILDTYGDLKGTHTHEQTLNNYTYHQKQVWIQSAQDWADERGIDYEFGRFGINMLFTFDRFADQQDFAEHTDHFHEVAMTPKKVVHGDFGLEHHA